LIQRLLSRRHQPEANLSSFMSWPGQSGKEYPFEVQPLDAVFRALPANFVYARQDEEGNWIPIYMAQTRDMHQRLEGHVSLDDAISNGATHIHVHYCTAGQAARCTEERDLLLRWKPVCNESSET